MKKLLLILSLSLLMVGSAFGHKIIATFTYDDTVVEGFKLYDNGVFLCASTDPALRTLECDAALGFGAHSFTLTAYVGDEESPYSTAFPMVITLITPDLGSVVVED